MDCHDLLRKSSNDGIVEIFGVNLEDLFRRVPFVIRLLADEMTDGVMPSLAAWGHNPGTGFRD